MDVSTCCHSVNLLVQKYFPDVLPYLADVVSPMQAHCRDIKRRVPNAKCVFIGPCVAKKDEAEQYKGIVDAVLTFEELTAWLKEAHITPVDALSVPGAVIAQCTLHIECRIRLVTEMALDQMDAETRARCYGDNDAHTLYFGEVIACYRTDEDDT